MKIKPTTVKVVKSKKATNFNEFFSRRNQVCFIQINFTIILTLDMKIWNMLVLTKLNLIRALLANILTL